MASLNSHAKALARFWKGQISWDKSMSLYSTFKVGGPAEAILSVDNLGDLQRLMHWLHENDINWWIIGRGSNILVPDEGLAGVTIILEGDFNAIERLAAPREEQGQDKSLLRAGGGCPLRKLVNYCTTHCLSGLEFAVGIPGSIGGAVVMNAGAWGCEINDIINSVSLMDSCGNIFEKKRKDLGLTYRGWSMGVDIVLLSATFSLTAGDKEAIKSACKRFQELRKKNQPLTESSAGSFFKNPPKHSAGRLIDAAGLKGFSIGGAKVSEKHANFIVNTGEATAADILNLMHEVQERVFQQFGIRLEPEVHILGRKGGNA
jgi:UDP-N-acetylmuramate dehydrogenase